MNSYLNEIEEMMEDQMATYVAKCCIGNSWSLMCSHKVLNFISGEAKACLYNISCISTITTCTLKPPPHHGVDFWN